MLDACLGRDATVCGALLAAETTVGGGAFAMHASQHGLARVTRAVRRSTRAARPAPCTLCRTAGPRSSSMFGRRVVAATREVGGAAFAMHAAPHRSAAIDRAVRHATREPRPSACMRPHASSAIIVGG
jgi:hypothetical protein